MFRMWLSSSPCAAAAPCVSGMSSSLPIIRGATAPARGYCTNNLFFQEFLAQFRRCATSIVCLNSNLRFIIFVISSIIFVVSSVQAVSLRSLPEQAGEAVYRKDTARTGSDPDSSLAPQHLPGQCEEETAAAPASTSNYPSVLPTISAHLPSGKQVQTDLVFSDQYVLSVHQRLAEAAGLRRGQRLQLFSQSNNHVYQDADRVCLLFEPAEETELVLPGNGNPSGVQKERVVSNTADCAIDFPSPHALVMEDYEDQDAEQAEGLGSALEENKPTTSSNSLFPRDQHPAPALQSFAEKQRRRALAFLAGGPSPAKKQPKKVSIVIAETLDEDRELQRSSGYLASSSGMTDKSRVVPATTSCPPTSASTTPKAPRIPGYITALPRVGATIDPESCGVHQTLPHEPAVRLRKVSIKPRDFTAVVSEDRILRTEKDPRVRWVRAVELGREDIAREIFEALDSSFVEVEESQDVVGGTDRKLKRGSSICVGTAARDCTTGSSGSASSTAPPAATSSGGPRWTQALEDRHGHALQTLLQCGAFADAPLPYLLATSVYADEDDAMEVVDNEDVGAAATSSTTMSHTSRRRTNTYFSLRSQEELFLMELVRGNTAGVGMIFQIITPKHIHYLLNLNLYAAADHRLVLHKDVQTLGDAPAMCVAAFCGHRDLVQFLLQYGGRHDVSSCWGLQPLHYAVMQAWPQVAYVLAGANACIYNSDNLWNSSPLDFAKRGAAPLAETADRRTVARADERHSLCQLLLSEGAGTPVGAASRSNDADTSLAANFFPS
ncbi:unnamed protein product [Amoebophrya sp. A120]|nr:unnamed protein product [Amoebophrya sp. A120]|eukprot:GSA120T00006157001.1